jgi:TPR repeat protein
MQYRRMNGHSIIPVFAVIGCFGLVHSAVADNALYCVPTDLSLTVADQNRCRPLSQRVPYNYDGDEDFAIVRQKSDWGDVDAMNRLGIMYASGRGVEKNDGRALIWFRRSALLGYAPAMANLGTMYQRGVGVRRNYRQAYMWLRVAVALGVPEEDHDAIIFKLGMIASRMGTINAVRAERVADEIARSINKQCGFSAAR